MLRDPAAPQARSVSRGYLRAMGVRLLEGRWFDAADGAGNAQVLLVTRALARRYFGLRSPIGAQVRLLPGPHPWTIVGVVDDIHNGMPWEEPYSQFFMDPLEIGYRAYHPQPGTPSFLHNHSLVITRGLNGPSWQVANPPGAEVGEGGLPHTSVPKTLGDLLGDEPIGHQKCAFAVNLHSHVKTTNGAGTLTKLDASATAAFAAEIV